MSPLTQLQIVSFPAPSSGSQAQPSPHMLPPSWSSTTPWSCSPDGPCISPSPTTEPDPERKLPRCASVQTRSTLSRYDCSTDSDLPHWPRLLAVSPVPPALPYPNASPHSPITSISRSLLQTPLPPADSMDFLACFCHWLLTATCPSVLSAHRVTPLLSSFLREGMLDLAL